jgi:magnesium transporter
VTDPRNDPPAPAAPPPSDPPAAVPAAGPDAGASGVAAATGDAPVGGPVSGPVSESSEPGAGPGGTDATAPDELPLEIHGVRPKDPEEAQRALADVQDLLQHYAAVREQARREAEAADEERAEIVTQVSEAQYLSQLRARVERLHPADVAYVLEALPPEERLLVWDSVKEEADGAILLEVSEPVRDSLIASMSRADLVAAVKGLDADDLVDLADALPPEVVDEVRRLLSPQERERLRAAMSYPEDTVGARMDFDLVTVREDVKLEVVLRYLRRFDELPQHTDQVFVVDRYDTLKGSLPIDQLLINEPDARVADVMRRDVLALSGLDDVSEAAQAFERYDLVSAPVVDPHGHLIGRLTIDEVVDIIREEGDAEVLNQAGLREEEDLFASIWHSARNRWLWLALNLITAFFASRVIGLFDGTIERVVALAALMPIVAGVAGNSGNQTMTLVVRSLALGHLNRGNIKRLLRKELVIAALNGVVWGGVAGLFAWLLYRDSPYGPLLGLTMTLAIMLNLLIGALIGVLVPLALERAGRDPAIGSSVLLTFSTDSLGFLIFLGLATVFFSR